MEIQELHRCFLDCRDQFKKNEAELIRLLQIADKIKFHRRMGYPSLFKYATEIFGFSEAVAYSYIAVARRALDYPELTRGLSVSKAHRIVRALSPENAHELIRFAKENTSAKIDQEVARINPKHLGEKLKPIAEEVFELRIEASKDFLALLKRVESLQAQRGKESGRGHALEAGLREYLRRHDPVEKARRFEKRKVNAVRGANGKKQQNHAKNTRTPLTAQQKHAVHERDGGRCIAVDENGRRCNEDRWVELHHVHHVEHGGGNDPKNIATLCSFHHRAAHH